ncbi:chromate efflux protein [Herbaspirillum rubrisubalbicans M1]|uniref:chromate efflux transporter n=1 Tax=Herbaspirillum rubrisubalbicans TaxID=80842 RepID=UPI00073A41BC|nr:chromate efflux transporter [Herbaspirillum rubrisubalbicans]ALU88267.1 chromate efflux protein [Herbaspirillum rubrisubalbicans M1]
MSTTTTAPSPREPIWPLFLVFLRLGLTSFGGPAAHLGYFRQEFVARRHWLSEQTYADLVAMCQFLPGPSSSQVGLAIGLIRGGYRGALAAWLGFTLPSAVLLMVVALSVLSDARWLSGEVVHGLKIVAVAIVAQAVWGMAQTLCRGPQRLLIMILAALATGLLHGSLVQLGVIVLAGLAGRLLLHGPQMTLQEQLPLVVSRRAGRACLLLFFVLLAGIPLLASLYPAPWLQQVNIFYRVGSLVFGGGHVVLPLLQAELVPTGWVDKDVFLAGYGAAQAVPGPLFTLAAYLGVVMSSWPNGVTGGVLCLLAIFAPSFLLVTGLLPFWDEVRRQRAMQAALAGVNAAVVGLLLAALYQPVWTSAIFNGRDLLIALAAFAALVWLKLPSWAVVLLAVLAAVLLK